MADESVVKPETDEDFLLGAGISPEALALNEGLLTPAQKVALKETYGAAVAGMFEGKIENQRKAAISRQKAAEKAQDSVFLEALPEGVSVSKPKEAFERMRTWARENLDQEEYEELAKMTKQGGRHQKLAMRELVSKYVEAGKLESDADLIVPDKVAGRNADYISAEDYVKKLKEYEDAGDSRDSKRIRALAAQRLRSRNTEK